jgi:hypothetical protein
MTARGTAIVGYAKLGHAKRSYPEVSASDFKKALYQKIKSNPSSVDLSRVKVPTQGAFKDWQMRQERKSPNYTTSWEECPVA